MNALATWIMLECMYLHNGNGYSRKQWFINLWGQMDQCVYDNNL